MSEDLLREPLPEPWTFGATNDGRVFFINDEEKRTTWLHPDNGEPVRTGFRHRRDLPQGWEEGFTETGASYLINHNREITTFSLPEKTDDKSKSSKKSKPKKSKPPKESLYQNIDNETLRQERKAKRRSSSFLERSGINIFRRSSSKSRERPEQTKVKKRPSSRRMKERKEKPEKTTKSARPTSATSIRSNQSTISVQSKMTASWRNPNKEVVKTGWLYKQDSTGTMKMWRKKWFVLVDFCLYYYKDSKEDEILGSIILPSYTVRTMTADDKINRKYAFKVEHAGMRAYYLSADSYNDMAQWITALQKCCHPITPNLDKPKEKEKEKEKQESEEDDVDGKGTDGSKRKKETKTKVEEDNDSEFGFNHVVPPPKSISSQSTDQEHKRDKSPASSSNNNNKHDPQSHTKNGRLPSDSHRSPKILKQQEKPQATISPSKAQELYQQSIPRDQVKSSPQKQDQTQSKKDPRQNKPAHRQDIPHMRQHPQQKVARRENGESAYFSDTSGATDSSGRPSNAQRGHHHQPPPQNKVRRQDSLVKLGNWVNNQKMRQSGSTLNSPQRSQPPSNFDTASEFSSVSQQYTKKSATISARGQQKFGPPSSRRYRARTYNEYMDPMEVASSTISMPPIQHMNRMQRAQTLPRPQSSEDIDKMGRPIRKTDPGNRMASSKSAGNIIAVDQYGNPISPRQIPREGNFNNSKRAKSDYVLQGNDDLQQQYIANFRKAQSKGNQAFQAPRQQHKSQLRPQSAGRSSNSSGGGHTPRRGQGQQSSAKSTGTPNDVFSPRSDVSSARSTRSSGQNQAFRFDVPNNTSPRGKASTLPAQTRTPDSSYEVKQVQRGQLRAFVVSSRSPQVQLPPPERQTPLKATENIPKITNNIAAERDIEAKLKKLNESDRAFQHISVDVSNLLADRERLEADLSIVRSKLHHRYSTGSREVDTQQHKLEQELGNVRAQLANANQKLKEMGRENENFEYEIRGMKTSILEQLRNKRSPSDNVYNSVSYQDKEAKRKLEWELGRVEFIIEGLQKQKASIKDKLADINQGRDVESPLSPLSPPGMLSANGRSPRDVKRASMDRRTTQNRPSYSSASSSGGGTPNSTPVKKFFTLPGRGVPHATSVDSVTADSLMKSPRPTSARSVSSIGSGTSNLHRTKSASERLFNAPYGQGSDHEAKEMKRLQKEILRNRRNNLMSGGEPPRRYSNPTGMTLPTRSHMKVGIDVQMALKHHRMPKVLQRAKRDRAETHTNQAAFDIEELEREVAASQKPSGLYSQQSYRYNPEETEKMVSVAREIDVEPEEITVDVNLTHQLISPDKVEIPERYVEYENIELTPAEEKMKHRKVAAIERMLAKSGQQASLPAVHLAAALAVEAGSVARAVAMHASAPQRHPGDGQKENYSGERPVTDGSSSAGEEVDSEPSPPPMDPNYTQVCIV